MQPIFARHGRYTAQKFQLKLSKFKVIRLTQADQIKSYFIVNHQLSDIFDAKMPIYNKNVKSCLYLMTQLSVLAFILKNCGYIKSQTSKLQTEPNPGYLTSPSYGVLHKAKFTLSNKISDTANSARYRNYKLYSLILLNEYIIIYQLQFNFNSDISNSLYLYFDFNVH
jgi:hypothetical protein